MDHGKFSTEAAEPPLQVARNAKIEFQIQAQPRNECFYTYTFANEIEQPNTNQPFVEMVKKIRPVSVLCEPANLVTFRAITAGIRIRIPPLGTDRQSDSHSGL